MYPPKKKVCFSIQLVRPPFDSVQLVIYNSNFTMVYGTQITIVTGANLNQLMTGEPHIVAMLDYQRVKNDDFLIKNVEFH